jgi:hypothetical protein
VKPGRTIADLELDPARESALHREFASWAEHFRARLRDGGLRALLADYATLVESTETQRCSHGAVWQDCCGVSYEFANDLAVRDALRIILRVVGPDDPALPLEQLDALDRRLHALYEHGPPRSGAWWRQGLPRGILP